MGNKNRKQKDTKGVAAGEILSPDEERACETIARIIAKMQARVRAEAAAMKTQQRNGVADV